MAADIILIVEDNDTSRKLIRDILVYKGYDVVEAATAEDGLRLAHERRPSLVLMDIRLPGIDGVEALASLRVDPATRDIPVMAMTASVMTAELQRLTKAGFDAYHRKPIEVKEFVAMVEQLLAPGRPRAPRRSG